ncbi:thiamine pyrophosphate-dependent enzyme [Aeromicrobium sp. 50.2.37]|uniref:thiamine pyrophosphate-dependent enzyme n=1 Tax=Aeromicrobium sp. 50.2.37 TaxID=2969305 RepID=UPI00214F9B11|nr:thiamine pyrophosphate-dependent enzyme [Aeromicrobium sp. 50.2.37]MCR4512684.1 thiamine pyrophosphate-binding protein [Aeromicrobium sp. 50.2.37]
MSRTVAQLITDTIADLGVTDVWGVVGDALNPITDAVRTDERLRWIGVRHEEAGAFAAGAQAQVGPAGLGVCMGTVGPGSIHLLNGLYDAKKSGAPVLAICGQVPTTELGSDYFQEVDNDALFSDVAVYSRTITSAAQAAPMLEQALNAALQRRGVAVLTVPGDVGSLDLPKGTRVPHVVRRRPAPVAASEDVATAARLLADGPVTLLVGQGARGARDQVLALAERLQAPMVLTLKAKPGLEHDNAYQVGQSGLIGNPAAQQAFEDCRTLFLVGTDFPYRDWYPDGKTVLQLDLAGDRIGRRVPVELGLVGDAARTLDALLPQLAAHDDAGHLTACRDHYLSWHERQQHLADPGYDHERLGVIRKAFDNPEHAIRPEALAAAVDRHAAQDAIFTSDTGMATTWMARFITMSGTRELLGSFNLGSMANAMPQALGVAAAHPDRQVVGLCGDGGLTMLLGDLITAVSHGLAPKLVVFDNGSLGMVRLEQEQGGLPTFGTELANPDLAAVARAIGWSATRVEDPHELDDAVARFLAEPGPALLDVVTNPDEISVPGRITPAQVWGFAIAKSTEVIESARSR